MRNIETLSIWLRKHAADTITRADLEYCIQNFAHDRKSLGFNGLLNMQKINITGQDLRGLDITTLDISQSVLSGTIFDRQGLEHLMKLAKSNKQGISGIIVQQEDLSGINFANIIFNNVIFYQVTLDRKALLSLLPALKKKAVSISNANLSGLDLGGRTVENHALGIPMCFEFLDLRNIDFSKCNLSNAKLSGCMLDDANFSEANLSNADLSGSYIRNTCFTGANLDGALLMHSDLSGANFQSASMLQIRV